jgi:hypothetical protein
MGHYDDLADSVLPGGFATGPTADLLRDELLFQRAVQGYLWTLPAVSMWAMKEASEARFGGGYHVLPVWQKRVDARTRVTTPNFDFVQATGYLDLEAHGPVVVEVPAGVQGLLDDAWQRPVAGPRTAGRTWAGDLGFAGPDAGRGGTYVLLPPGYQGTEPDVGWVYRPRTANVFVLWRASYHDPTDLGPAVRRIEEIRTYPLNGDGDAVPMEFPHASGVDCDLLFPRDGGYFDMLDRFVQAETADPADLDMRGLLHTLGIQKGGAFKPDAHRRDLLDKAARTAWRISKLTLTELLPLEPGGTYYPGRPWLDTLPGGDTSFRAGGTFTNLEQRTGYFTGAYGTSPDTVAAGVDKGVKCLTTARDADGDLLDGARSYALRLPPGIPAALFWSVSIYDAATASGVDNGQAFPSINTMDRPTATARGAHDVYFGPTKPAQADDTNWIRTLPGDGYFVVLRLYGPGKAFFDRRWKPGDLQPLG